MTDIGSDNLAPLDALIGNLRKLASNAEEQVAKEALLLITAVAKATAAAGTDPYGVPWRPRKDGSRAIPDAANAVDVVLRGSILVVRVHRGAAIQNYLGGDYRREVIPDGDKPLPRAYVDAIQLAASRVFARVTSGS